MHQKQLDTFCAVGEKFLKNKIRSIVEIGARDCAETVAFAERFPEARVYAFECNPETLPICRERVAGKKNVTLIEAAVTDQAGPITFYQINTSKTKTDYPGGNPGASSIFPASGNYPLEQYVQNQITVPSTTLQDFFAAQAIPSVDLLWMDIQGAELAALRGAGSDLAKIKLIHLEVEFFSIYKHQPLAREVKKFLNRHRFAFHSFTSPVNRYSTDAIYIRRDLYHPSWLQETFAYYFRPLIERVWNKVGRTVVRKGKSLIPKRFRSRSHLYQKTPAEFFTNRDQATAVFTSIYERNIWGNGSGEGSSLTKKDPYVRLLEQFIQEKQIRRVVDVGCGDWQFSRLVDWQGSEYLGIDVVASVIAANQKIFATPTIRFICADPLEPEFVFPPADLIIIKDVLQHLSNAHVLTLLEKLKQSSARYALITNDYDTRNPDIPNGDTRPLDVRRPPFNLAGVTSALTYGDKKVLVWENPLHV